MEKVNLLDLTRLANTKRLNSRYVKYLLDNRLSKYRHEEILTIKSLLKKMNLASIHYSNFYYSFMLPRINKEFDLIKYDSNALLNIELKSEDINHDRIKNQLIQNAYYLKMVSKKIYSFTYVKNTNKLFYLNENKLIEVEFDVLEKVLSMIDSNYDFDIDKLFSLDNILISPIKTPKRFFDGDYILTETQENLKINLLSNFEKNNRIGISGYEGTGKTLLMYDIAKTLSINNKVLILTSNKVPPILNEIAINYNINIIQNSNFDYEINKFDLILIDGANLFRLDDFIRLKSLIIKNNKPTIISYDEHQFLYETSQRLKLLLEIKSFVKESYKLRMKIRRNEEISYLISCLKDLNKIKNGFKFKDIKVIYMKKAEVKDYILSKKDYEYISFEDDIGTKYDDVIGNEFDKMIIMLDEKYYFKNNSFRSHKHKNPSFAYAHVILEAIKRVRGKLTIIVTNINILDYFLKIFNE